MKHLKNISFSAILIFTISACSPKVEAELPILGNSEVIDGKTIYHEVKDFSFTDQNGNPVNQETFKGKNYIVDYFFTSCPTICPKVKKQELRVYEKFKDNPDLMYLSVSIDTKYDTVPRLKWYADKLNIDDPKWRFVTGDKDHIYKVAESFFHVAMDDETAPGGFNHDGRLILIDENKHIRSFCDGTIPEEVDRFIKDLENILND